MYRCKSIILPTKIVVVVVVLVVIEITTLCHGWTFESASSLNEVSGDCDVTELQSEAETSD